MECDDIRDAFRRGVVPGGSEVVAHAYSCSPCSQLLENGGELGKRLALSQETLATEELLSDVYKELAARATWLDRIKELNTTVRLGLAALVAAALCVLVAAAMPRPDWHGAGRPRVDLILVAYGLVLAACTRALLAPLSRARRMGLLFATIAASFALPWLVALWPPDSFPGPITHWGKRAFGCFVFGSALGAPFLALLWLVDRTNLRSPLSGTFGLLAFGLVGNMALALHCALAEPLHLAVAHASLSATWLALWAAFRRLSNS